MTPLSLHPIRLQDTLLKAAVLVLAAAWIYSPVYHGEFLWDDGLLVTENFKRWSSWERLAAIWVAPDGPDYFPLSYTAFWLESLWFGADPTGYHVFTLGLHIVSGLLCWLLLARLQIAGGWLTALVFTIHPLCVESVAWISETKNTLSLPFFLASCVCWVEFEQATGWLGRRCWYAASLACFLLALLAKTTVVGLPVVLLLYAWWQRRRLRWRDVALAAPFFLVAGILGLVTLYFQRQFAIGDESYPVSGIVSRLAVAGPAIGFYLNKIFLPLNLSPCYSRWDVVPPRWDDLIWWPVFGAVAWWAWQRRDGWGRHLIFAFGFFLALLGPVLGFANFSFMRVSWVSDHFVYVAMLGPLAWAVAAGVTWQRDRFPSWQATMTGLTGLLIVTLLYQTFTYSTHWSTQRQLCEYTVHQNPDAWAAHLFLGEVARREGRMEVAIDHLIQASRLRPDDGTVQADLASLLVDAGRLVDATAVLEPLRAADPENRRLQTLWLECRFRAGDYQQVKHLAAEMLQHDPVDYRVLTTYGIALLRTGDRSGGIEKLQTALSIYPAYEPAQQALAASGSAGQ